MLFSLSLLFLCAAALGSLMRKVKLPPLLGMLATGIVLGPYALNLLDPSILGISADLRKIALIIILLRAGLNLNLADLRKNGRTALLMCFLPATAEILGCLVLGPRLLGMSLAESAIMGTVLAAVSPAVVVPKMLHLIEHGYGCDKSIPQLIMAGSSVDDIYVIVLFTSLLSGGGKSGKISFSRILGIPVSILAGAALGAFVGYVLMLFFKKVHIRDSQKVIILLCTAFLLVELEDALKSIDFVVPVAGLPAVMTAAMILAAKYHVLGRRLSAKFSKLWVAAEPLLFVLVGAQVNIKYAAASGVGAILLIAGALFFRALGVIVALIGTPFSFREKLFCMFAYMPKATVQAGIAAIPLGMGLACGESVLTVGVLSILTTAPLGAFLIDLSYEKFLKKHGLPALANEKSASAEEIGESTLVSEVS